MIHSCFLLILGVHFSYGFLPSKIFSMKQIDEIDLSRGAMRERMLQQIFQSNNNPAFTNKIKVFSNPKPLILELTR